jgi:hypothetical protein
MLPITIARAGLRSTELNIRSQILTLVQQAENAYWDVVGAREALRVSEEALKMRVESLNRSQNPGWGDSPLDISSHRPTCSSDPGLASSLPAGSWKTLSAGR